MKRILLFLAVVLLLTDVVSAQLLRQRIRDRIFGQGYRVGAPNDNEAGQNTAPQAQPLVNPPPQTGQVAERVIGIINRFAGNPDNKTGELKSVVVMSFASFKEFRRIAELTAYYVRLDKGSFQKPVLLNMFLNITERIIGANFDTSQPFGVILQTDGAMLYPMVFSPLDLSSKAGQNFQKEFTEVVADPNHTEIRRLAVKRTVFPQILGRLYVQVHNGWMFIATERQLNALPDDPTVLLQGLDKKCLAAARFDLQNMPSITVGTGLTLAEIKATGEAENDLEKAKSRLLLGYLRSLAAQADFLEYTFSFDEEHNDYVLEQKEIVKPKTERAKLLQERREAKSVLHGFYYPEHAVLASHIVMPLTKLQQDQLVIILDEMSKRLSPSGEKKKDAGEKENGNLTDANSAAGEQNSAEQDSVNAVAQKPIEKLFAKTASAYYAALIGAVCSGKLDGATTVSQEHGILGAYNISDGKKFQETFDGIFDSFQKEFPDFYAENVERNYAESDGFRLTRVSFAPRDFIKNPFINFLIPPEIADRETRLIFGVRDDYVCFAAGQGIKPEKELVAAIGKMNTALPVQDLFFFYSGYELGQVFAVSGNPNRLARLKAVAADTNPAARAFAVSKFTDDTKVLTFRISGLLTPSLWRWLR
ncbi:hypothetical protein FACS189419_02170 [Planctomycetales bacterium]|nr:hypothetical protein FACS189419_02170 [Planctomycetales bacterium]